MEKRLYNFRDVFIGILNCFSEESIKYDYNTADFDKFFFDRREEYSVLRDIAFDIDRNFQSKEIAEGYFNLEVSFLITSSEENPFRDKINKEAIKYSFERDVRQKFNIQELAEIERLSLEFQNEFVNKGKKLSIR